MIFCQKNFDVLTSEYIESKANFHNMSHFKKNKKIEKLLKNIWNKTVTVL